LFSGRLSTSLKMGLLMVGKLLDLDEVE
jgi:hypothetical protein